MKQLFLILCMLASLPILASDLVRYVESKKYPDPKQSYFVDLLTLALEESKDKYGSYQLKPVAVEMMQARTAIMVERNEFVDIVWRMTSKQSEQHLQAIYFPLLKGLMGHRIFIIRKSDQQFFHPNMPLAELKIMTLGQGYNWPDTEILKSNGFNVVEGNDQNLLKMLIRHRFDYFPRAIHEPWLEIKNKPEFAVEKYIMLKYPAPIYFFVNKNNQRLKERLEYGLNKLLHSGKFEHFFQTHLVTSGILQKANVKQRTVYELTNPLLSPESKKVLLNKALWNIN